VLLKHLAIVTAITGATLAAACGGQQSPAPQAPPANAKRVDLAKAGGLTGHVFYKGAPVTSSPVKLDSDPACVKQHPDGLALDTVLVNNGGLENVFVYVKSGLGDYAFETPAATITLDQKGCSYSPHVFGVQTGQPVNIVNSDATMHNVHAMGTANQEFNFAQPFAGIKNTKTFTAPEIMVHFKCNVHGWMSAYAGVVSHPYFAVSANGGAFELKNLPAGTYTVEAWHEKFGTKTQTVTVGEKETKSVDFTFES
jgi:plastocyanin